MAVRRTRRAAAFGLDARRRRPDPHPQAAAAPPELDRLIGAVERKGYTMVPLRLLLEERRRSSRSGSRRARRQHDKRATEKERDWAAREVAPAEAHTR